MSTEIADHEVETSPFAKAVTAEILTVADLAELTGAAEGTVRYWIHAGRAPRGFKIAGGRRTYFARADVIAWLDAGRAASA